MPTFKAVIFKHHKKHDGTYNVKIRVTQNRKKRYIATPYFIRGNHINRKYEIRDQRTLDLCAAIIDDFHKKIDHLGLALMSMDIDTLVRLCLSRRSDHLYYMDVFDEYKADRKLSQSTENSFIDTYRSLVKFFREDNIDLLSLSSNDIQDWMNRIGDCKLYANKLNALYNYAIKKYNDEENDIIVIKANPFKKLTIKSKKVSGDRSISVDDLRKIIDFHPKSKSARYARNMFLFSFYMVGMNFADIINLTPESISGEFIEYNRMKTKNARADCAFIRIRIPDEARGLIDDYYEKFKANCASRYIANCMRKLAKEVGIDNLIFYSARHTWATLAVNECGIDKYTVHLALNHVDQATAITDVYIKKDFSIIDRANRRVIDYVLSRKGGE